MLVTQGPGAKPASEEERRGGGSTPALLREAQAELHRHKTDICSHCLRHAHAAVASRRGVLRTQLYRGILKGRMVIKYRFSNPVFIKRQSLQMGWAESKPQVFSKTSPFLSWFRASPISSCRRVTWNLDFLIADKGKISLSAQHVQDLLFTVCFFKSLVHLKGSLDAFFKYFITKAL